MSQTKGSKRGGPPGVARAAGAAMLAAGAAIAQQVVGKATRDALFLSSYGIGSLPKAMIASALASLVAVLATTRLVARFGPGRVVPLAFAASAALSMIEWTIHAASPPLAALIVYLHMAVFGATVISAFWSLVNERFDPRSAKRYVGRIASGGTIGGVLGGALAFTAASSVGIRGMLGGMAALHAISALASVAVMDVTTAKAAGGADAGPSPASVLKAVPYLRDLALVVALVAMSETLLDWLLSAQATATWGSGPRLLSFFALFHMTVGLATFLAQIFVSRAALEGFGIAGTIAVLPATVLVGSFVALQAPRLWAAALVRGATSVISNSLYRSGYELLFTPIPLDRKRSTKTLVDVGFDRLGTALGGGVVMLVLWGLPTKARWVLLLVVALAAIAMLIVASRLHAGYVRALEENLERGAPRLGGRDMGVSQTNIGFDRDRLMREIENLRAEKLLSSGEFVSPWAWHDPAGSPEEPSRSHEEVSADLTKMMRDETSAREILQREGPLDRRLVSWSIDLLADPTLHLDALAALRKVADKHVGELVDAMLSTDTPFDARRRIPRVLARATSQRAVDGLVQGLFDERFEVRWACGLALVRLTDAHPDVHLDRTRVLEAARREVEADRSLWDAEPPLDPHEDEVQVPFLDRVLRDRTSRSLEHVFVLLSVGFDREPMRLALRALSSDDLVLRGTALEYLENVLPDAIREPLWPYIGDHRKQRVTSAGTPRRQRQELVSALLRSGPIATDERLAGKTGNPPKRAGS